MYIPKHFEESRTDVLHGLMRAHPLAALVTLGDDGLIVNHVPFLLKAPEGEFGTLTAHLPRSNPLWRQFSMTVETVAIFQGTDTYITPSWYPSKQEHGKAVPTWNYAVVHAHGLPRVIEDAEWILRHLAELTDEHERAQASPWKLSDAPEDFTGRLVESLVGIEIPISRLQGKWKVSQNRPRADKLGVVAGLQSMADEESRTMAEMVLKHVAP